MKYYHHIYSSGDLIAIVMASSMGVELVST